MSSARTGQASIATSTLNGTRAVPVEVQVDVASGIPMFAIVGLGDAAVLEARERVRSAIRASGFSFPNARVVVNLAPGPLRKHGTGFDLPIALALLVATGQIPRDWIQYARSVGELALDGSVRCVPGMLAHALSCVNDDVELIGSLESRRTLAALSDLKYRPLAHLRAVFDRTQPDFHVEYEWRPVPVPDMNEVATHEHAKRALEIAAAGGHNVLFIGPPGSGKTMLARRLPGILPQLQPQERVESAVIHSVAGLDESPLLAGVRPFRAPHHTASIGGLVGGGSPARPGEVSLAHNGVLFLDEFAEFSPSALQSLRQPMEDGQIVVVRAESRVAMPARFSLVAASNPCPCGFLGDEFHVCTCTEAMIARYRGRVGGPLMDRIDISLSIKRVDPQRIVEAPCGESSAGIAERVTEAIERARADSRQRSALLSGAALVEACRMSQETSSLLATVARAHHLSGRGVARLLKVARTIADLAGCDGVRSEHLIEAVGYRRSEC